MVTNTIGQASIAGFCSVLVLQGSVASDSQSANGPLYDFNIPQQDLRAALQEVALTSGYKLLYRSEIVKGIVSPPLRARYSVKQALDVLLAGTDLAYEITPATVVLIKKKATTSRIRNLILGSGLAATGLGVTPPSLAQGIQEIIVTAQKREESAQDIPVAIDVITGQTFIEEGIRDIKDMGKTSTELEINTRTGQATIIGVRGMQQLGFAPTGDTLTAVHLDGSYLFNFWGLNGMMFDLERVEVLAGPQGTLYGRNTAAGAVNLITRRPRDQFSADVSAEFGNFGTQRYNAGVDIPLADTFSMRLAGTFYERDALYTDGSAAAENAGARLSALWTPTERDTLFFTYDYIDTGGSTESGGLTNVDQGVDAYIPLTNTFTSSPPASVSTGLSVLSDDPYNNLPYNNSRNLQFVGDMESTHWGAMAQYTHDFGSFDMVLQYSHRDLEAVSRTATKATTQFFSSQWPQTAPSDVAELRFVSDAEGSLTWVGGLFWFNGSTIHGNATPNPTVPFGTFTGVVQTATGPISTLGTPAPDPNTGLDVPACPCTAGFYPVNGETTSYAAYGQMTWTPESMDRWHFTAGLRYTKDEKETEQGYYVNGVLYSLFVPGGTIPDYLQRSIITPAMARPGLPATNVNLNSNDTWDAWQWRLGAEWDVTDSSMLYGSISTGYKSGGYAYGSTPKLEPENLLAYEIGGKNNLVDNTVQFNWSAWWYDYEDLEAPVTRALQPPFPEINNVPQTAIGTVANVGKVEMAGFSFDVDWAPTAADRFGVSTTYIYSEVKDGYEEVNGVRNQVFNEGERYGDTPLWQWLGRYSHTFTLANGQTIMPAVKYQYQTSKYDGSAIPTGSVAAGVTTIDPRTGTYNLERQNPGQTEIPAQGILDFQIKYAGANGNWDITAYAHNLTDELDIKNLTYGNNPMAGGATGNYGHITALLGEPRTYGVILGMRF